MDWHTLLMQVTSNPVPVVDNNDPNGILDMFKTLGGFGMAAYLLLQQRTLLSGIKDNLLTLTTIVATRAEDDRKAGL
jgi:hypothetical protein